MTSITSAAGTLGALDRAGPAPARWFWLACAVLALLLIWPLATTLYPGMPDYPNHLARAQLIVNDQLHQREHPYYELRHVLIPNLALDTLVPLLVHAGLNVETAMRVFAGIALLLPVAGVIALGHAVQGTTPWLALLAFPLAFSRYYAWGFLNYFFALGLVLVVFAGWLHLRRRRPLLAGILLAPAAALSMVAHLVGFGVLSLLVITREGWLAWRARRAGRRPELHAALPAAVALALCAVFYLTAFERGLAPDMRWFETPLSKLKNLSTPFLAYGLGAGFSVAVLILGALAVLRRHSRIALRPGWAPPVVVLGLCFLLMPAAIMNSYYASARLLIAAVLVFVAFVSLRANARVHLSIVLVALLATGIKVADVKADWTRSSAQLADLRAALQVLPAGSRLYTVIAEGAQPDRPYDLYPARHAGSFAVIDRDAFIPNFFGFPLNGESVAFKPHVEALADMLNKDEIIFPPSEPIRWDLLCMHYDAVLVIEEGRWPDMPACARMLSESTGYRIYRLER